MLDAEAALPLYAETLEQAALAITQNKRADAADLVQETFLQVLQELRQGCKIHHLPEHLMDVLCEHFFRKAAADRMPLSFEALPESIADETDYIDELLEREEAKQVRKGLAYLPGSHREVVGRFYAQSQTVSEIAQALQIPVGTVLSRLDAGRQKIKEKVEKMEPFCQQSFLPEILTLQIDGHGGRGGEPWRYKQTAIEQNLLLLAYERPVTTQTLAKALGVAAPFVEDLVEHLLEGQLMCAVANRVATDFHILSMQDRINGILRCADFAGQTFDLVADILEDVLLLYKQIHAFDQTEPLRLYGIALMSLWQPFRPALIRRYTGKQNPYDNIPDRPNFGKWIARGYRYPAGYRYNDPTLLKYQVSSQQINLEINNSIDRLQRWDTWLGPMRRDGLPFSISISEFASIFYDVERGRITPMEQQLVPYLEQHGSLRTIDGKLRSGYPILTQAEFHLLQSIHAQAAERLQARLLEPAAEALQSMQNPPAPKHVSVVSDTYYICNLESLPICYVHCAGSRSRFQLEPTMHCPLGYLVLR